MAGVGGVGGIVVQFPLNQDYESRVGGGGDRCRPRAFLYRADRGRPGGDETGRNNRNRNKIYYSSDGGGAVKSRARTRYFVNCRLGQGGCGDNPPPGANIVNLRPGGLHGSERNKFGQLQ